MPTGMREEIRRLSRDLTLRDVEDLERVVEVAVEGAGALHKDGQAPAGARKSAEALREKLIETREIFTRIRTGLGAEDETSSTNGGPPRQMPGVQDGDIAEDLSVDQDAAKAVAEAREEG